MNKFIAFFKSKVTQVVAWIVLSLCIIALLIGGATTETISSGVALVGAIVAAVAALIAFINKQVNK